MRGAAGVDADVVWELAKWPGSANRQIAAICFMRQLRIQAGTINPLLTTAVTISKYRMCLTWNTLLKGDCVDRSNRSLNRRRGLKTHSEGWLAPQARRLL